MPDAPTGLNNRANPYYARENHIKLARIDRNRTEFFGTIGGVPDVPVAPPATLYVNSNLQGGAQSGPALGNNPPDNHILGFNTVNSGPVQGGEDWFNWEVNSEGATGRSYLSFSLAQNNPDLQVGDVVRLSYTIRKYSGSGNVVLSYSTNLGVNITDENTRAVDGEDVLVSYLIEITEVGYDFAVRVGTGVTSNQSAHLLISNPSLVLQGGGPTPRPPALPLPTGFIPEPAARFDTADGWNVPANVVIANGTATKNPGTTNNNLDYTVAGITPGMQTVFLYHAAMTAGTLNARWRAPTGVNAPGSLGSGAGESFVSMPHPTVDAHAGPRCTLNNASTGEVYYFNAFDLSAALAGLLDIHLLWGQSNMGGASATTDRLTYQSYEPRALVINGFESTSQGALNDGSGPSIHPSLGTNYGVGVPRQLVDGVVMASVNAFGVSPAVSIAKAICNEGTEPGRTPIFVASASGGTKLEETWNMVDGSDWLLMLAQIDYLMSLNPGNRIRSDFICLGESDRSLNPNGWALEMKSRVDYLRNTYNDHPTIFLEIGGPRPDPSTDAMVAEQLKLQTGSGDPAELTQCTVVPRPPNWGPLEDDTLDVHFPPKDNVVRGADAAEALLQWLYPGTTRRPPSQSITRGPFTTQSGREYFIRYIPENNSSFSVGFDVVDGPDPDVFIPITDVLALQNVSQQTKDHVSTNARSFGWLG